MRILDCTAGTVSNIGLSACYQSAQSPTFQVMAAGSMSFDIKAHIHMRLASRNTGTLPNVGLPADRSNVGFVMPAVQRCVPKIPDQADVTVESDTEVEAPDTLLESPVKPNGEKPKGPNPKEAKSKSAKKSPGPKPLPAAKSFLKAL